MISTVEELRNHGLMAAFGIAAIKIYQDTFSKVTPPRCRYTPSCSQYGIEAIQEWGLIQGIQITRERISRCHRPNGGYDPIPQKNPDKLAISRKKLGTKVTQKTIEYADFETIPNQMSLDVVTDYHHQFRLILSYPIEREFLSRSDFKSKITEFKQLVLEIPTYALLYQISQVEVGAVGDYYLLRFAGTIAGEYLENSTDEVIQLITEQLAGFLLAARANEFDSIYFEVDGQVFIAPQPEEKVVPMDYKVEQNFWDFTSDDAIWDIYWGSFTIDAVVDMLAEVSGVGGDLLASGIDSISDSIQDPEFMNVDTDLAIEGCQEDLSLNEGCDVDGCALDINPFDGCNGCA